MAASEGRYDEAVSALESMRDGGALTDDGALLLADLYVRTDRPADAVRLLQGFVMRDPASRGARGALARALLAAGDAPGAVRQLNAEGTARDSDSAHQELLGQALLASAELAGARRALERAIEIDPSRFEARLALARITGREPIAEVAAAWGANLAARVRRTPDEPQVRIVLARVHLLAARPADAEQSLRAALALSPELPEANLALARLFLVSGRTVEAVPHLHAVLRSVRRHRQANVLLAEHYEGAGDAVRAAHHLEAAYAEPRPVDVTLRLASLHGEARQFDVALALATTAVRAAPRSAAAHAVLGRVHRLRGDTRAAVDAYQVAFELDHDLTSAHLALAPGAAGPDAVRAALGR